MQSFISFYAEADIEIRKTIMQIIMCLSNENIIISHFKTYNVLFIFLLLNSKWYMFKW